ncbi:MAG: hypothetical protein R3297_08560, partial [Desulfobulbales bacterium]|nr:hypothetical protein [Desulfobulbales bacterium]
ASWFLSGSLCHWGDFTRRFFDLVVFLWVPAEIRLARLRARELQKYGEIILDPDSNEHKSHQLIMQWASAYDTGGYNMQSRKQHERWLSGLTCQIIRLEGDRVPAENITAVLHAMGTDPGINTY